MQVWVDTSGNMIRACSREAAEFFGQPLENLLSYMLKSGDLVLSRSCDIKENKGELQIQ